MERLIKKVIQDEEIKLIEYAKGGIPNEFFKTYCSADLLTLFDIVNKTDIILIFYLLHEEAIAETNQINTDRACHERFCIYINKEYNYQTFRNSIARLKSVHLLIASKYKGVSYINPIYLCKAKDAVRVNIYKNVRKELIKQMEKQSIEA